MPAGGVFPDVVRRHVLHAIAAGIEAADEDVARKALARIDWILRGRARRRLEAALLEAALKTNVTDYTDPAAVRHVLRAAALIVRGETKVALADAVRVAAAHETFEPRPPVRWPVATVVAGAVALATATTVAAATAFVVTGPPSTAYERPAAPPPVGVFKHGGVPRRDAAIEQTLGVQWPAVVSTAAALAHDGPPDESKRAALLAQLRADPAMAMHGPAIAGAWQNTLDALEAWLPVAPPNWTWPEVSADLRARLDLLSDAFAQQELGYYIDPEMLGDHPRRRSGIHAYRIETIGFVRANDAKVRVLDVRRLGPAPDRGGAMLGLTSEELETPVVLLDAIDTKIQTQLMPVLAGAPFSLGDDAWASRRGRALSVAAGGAIRRELLAALYTDAQSADKAMARARQLVATSVRHHEAQHDLDKGGVLAHPLPLARILTERKNEPFAVRARYELSAYLSQIASDTWLPQLTLWSLARHAFRRGAPRAEEQFVAVVAVEAMARQLGITSPGPVVHGGEIDRDRLAALLGPMTGRTTVELRSAAAAAWGELFEEPLVRLYD